jgi:hypothetical protein
MRRTLAAIALSFNLLFAAPSSDPVLRSEVKTAMRRAAEFFRTQVTVQGGYLWRYSEDLSLREGEGKATATMAWVQPPGTPSVGMAFLDAHRATGDAYYLDAARQTAHALVSGQLRSGGWDYLIEFDPALRPKYAYRFNGDAGGKNVTTLDDDNTQSALRLLMRVDEALKFKDEKIHETALFALGSLLAAQYPNGGWPQRFEHTPDPDRFPTKRASYPESWSRTYPAVDYRGYYTFNDNTIADMIETMFLASRIYRNSGYRKSAEKAAGFILLAQMPEPQPAWAQQYDADMHPAWARKFEPPAVTGGESQGVLEILLTLYRETGDPKYLEPVPRAIAYLRRSRLAGGTLARFYELKTNQPLYFTKDYTLTYSDVDMPTHYAFKVADRLDKIESEYQGLQRSRSGKSEPSRSSTRIDSAETLARQARNVIGALDERGRWVEEGQLRFQGDSSVRRIINCRTFVENMRTLVRYLEATKP